MTAPTPEQMRVLADDADDQADYWHTRTPAMVKHLTSALRTAAETIELLMQQRDTLVEYNAALRAAADQLDAVRDVVGRMPFTASRQALRAILTADTAPQEDRDE